MKVYVAQLNPIIGDLDGNSAKIIAAIEDAKKLGKDLIVFPELTICGYPPEDLVLHHTFIESMEQHLESIAKVCIGITAIVGLVRRNLNQGEKMLLNSAAVIQNGKILGFYDKWLLPTYDVFNERRYFEPGQLIRTWEIAGKSVGVVICEDIWQHAGCVETRYSRDPILELKQHKIDLLINLSASPYQFQKPDIRVEVCAKAAKTLCCPVILCCQAGANTSLLFDGYSVYVTAKGELAQLGKGFVEDRMMIDTDVPICPCTFEYDTMQDLYSALVMGVSDYFSKNRFKKALLGLSGGIDSALVACIAVDALGAKNVLGVAMPSKYSSEGSVSDAKLLAESLGVEVLTIPIHEAVDSIDHMLVPHFEGREVDVTEENIQARIRGLLLMALSNKFGHIVLSTGNKSEVALGYSTLYGDMCGGLGVIGDLLKTVVYDLSRWINRDRKRIPDSTITKPPSAELRPNQTDFDSLPEYGIVDAVLKGYVEAGLSMGEIASKYEIPLELVMDLVGRIHSAEYKRRQGPPILRVTNKSFGVGRHYPIVQGWA